MNTRPDSTRGDIDSWHLFLHGVGGGSGSTFASIGEFTGRPPSKDDHFMSISDDFVELDDLLAEPMLGEEATDDSPNIAERHFQETK